MGKLRELGWSNPSRLGGSNQQDELNRSCKPNGLARKNEVNKLGKPCELTMLERRNKSNKLTKGKRRIGKKSLCHNPPFKILLLAITRMRSFTPLKHLITTLANIHKITIRNFIQICIQLVLNVSKRSIPMHTYSTGKKKEILPIPCSEKVVHVTGTNDMEQP